MDLLDDFHEQTVSVFDAEVENDIEIHDFFGFVEVEAMQLKYPVMSGSDLRHGRSHGCSFIIR